MKKLVYKCETIGAGGKTDLEIYLDINRELTDIDTRNINQLGSQIIESVHEESKRLDPKTAEETKNNRLEIISLFSDRAIFVEEIPNGYHPAFNHLHWFIVTTKKGRINNTLLKLL